MGSRENYAGRFRDLLDPELGSGWTSEGRAGGTLDSRPDAGSAADGIAIFMYWNEGVHARPHFHARYSGQAASIDFHGNVIAGSLPPRAVEFVREWAQLHRAELEANWARARRDETLEAIEPLP